MPARKSTRKVHKAKKRAAAKAWPVKKVVANLETRLHHVEQHLAKL
jgi:hypothetical protein